MSEDKSLYIGGKWLEARGGERFASDNPATGETLGTVPRGRGEDIDLAVQAAQSAFPAWRDTPPDERGRWLLKLAAAVRGHSEAMALLHARESGHYLAKARGLVEFTAQGLEFHAGLADKARGASLPTGPDRLALTRLEPVGVTGHIIPWNYPLALITRSVAPALALGNTAVVKPAEQTPLVALALAEIVHEVGLPPGVFNVVTGYGEEAGAPLAAHPGVRSLTFTGSVPVGQSVMRAAAANMTKLTLELGGKTPVLVFPDAEVEMVTEAVMQGILSRCGQVCIAGSRLLVHESLHDRLVAELVQRFQQVRVGDTLAADTEMGPLISAEQLARVEAYVRIGVEEGATLAVGGKRPQNPELQRGHFYLPTLFTEVTSGMRIAQEEIFGPVLVVLRWKDEAELISLANDTPYGLAAAIWCRELAPALRVASRLESGVVFVNEWLGEDLKGPHGGYKLSGLGRENGLECIEHYTEVKQLVISLCDRKTESWCEAPL